MYCTVDEVKSDFKNIQFSATSSVTIDEVNQAFKEAAEGQMRGILEYCDKPLVSMDFKGNSASAIFDAQSTVVMEQNMIKVMAWYDNEWGYSCRLIDLVEYIASKGL